MLSRPECGWTDIKLGCFEGRGSYLTDIPLELLNSFISSLIYNIPASIFFDEEGSEFILVSYYDKTYIILDRDKKTNLINIEIDFFDLIHEVIYDIESNIFEWVNWYSYKNSSKEELLERELLIVSKINELKRLLEIKS